MDLSCPFAALDPGGSENGPKLPIDYGAIRSELIDFFRTFVLAHG